MRRELDPRRGSGFRTAATVAACLLVTLLLPLIGIGGRWDALTAVTTSPALVQLQTWVSLAGVQAMCWTLVMMWSVPHLRRLMAELPDRRELATRCVLPVLLLLIPWLAAGAINRSRGFPPSAIGGVPITGVIGVSGVLVAAVVTFGLFVVFHRARLEMTVEQPPLTAVLKLGALISLFHQLLFAAAVVLALGIVGTAALLRAAGAERPGQFSSEFVIVFGVVGSLFLLAAYAPLRLGLYRQSSELIERALGTEPARTEDLGEWLAQRDSLERVLGQDATSAFGFGGILTSLVPMVAGSAMKLLG